MALHLLCRPAWEHRVFFHWQQMEQDSPVVSQPFSGSLMSVDGGCYGLNVFLKIHAWELESN